MSEPKTTTAEELKKQILRDAIELAKVDVKTANPNVMDYELNDLALVEFKDGAAEYLVFALIDDYVRFRETLPNDSSPRNQETPDVNPAH